MMNESGHQNAPYGDEDDPALPTDRQLCGRFVWLTGLAIALGALVAWLDG